MPTRMFNGNVTPKLKPKYSDGLASGSANRNTAGTAMYEALAANTMSNKCAFKIPDLFQHLQPVHFRHFNIQENQVRPVLPDGQPSWTLHDPSRNLFFRIDWPTFELLRHWTLGEDLRILARTVPAVLFRKGAV